MKLQEQRTTSTPSPRILTAEDVCEMLRPRPVDAHKGMMGHALLVAGSQGMAGAAILASKSCLHSGIGKLTVHTASANNVILQCTVPEAILHGDRNEKTVTECLPTQTYQAAGMGPGLGTDEATAESLKQYLHTCKAPMVLDADALNILAQHEDWVKHIPSGTILTPHVGEFERLTHKCANHQERVLVAKAYAETNNLYIVLKGHPSIVCTPEGELLACPYGNNGMATPGSGDVLTGLITGLLAQGYTSYQSAILGVWIHALAGDAAAKDLGEEYMLAGDIVTHIIHAYRQLKSYLSR